LIERTKRSAWAFKFGLLGGSRKSDTPATRRRLCRCAVQSGFCPSCASAARVVFCRGQLDPRREGFEDDTSHRLRVGPFDMEGERDRLGERHLQVAERPRPHQQRRERGGPRRDRQERGGAFGSSFRLRFGQRPGWSLVTSGCIGLE
jgi:hypothetical protein